MELTVNALCRGDTKRPILLELLELQKKGPKNIYSHVTTLENLKQQGLNYQAIFSQNERACYTLGLSEFSYTERSSFLDYVIGGCEISLLIGIDFTKSNGDPKESDSLHHIDDSKTYSDKPNEYLQAIQGVGDILQYYDSDKKIPVYGFGAKLPASYTHVSHCFALNGNIFDPEVNGIPEVKEVYKKSLKQVILHGPTIFSQLIEMASIYASAKESSQEQQQYFILLILTDGIINDMELARDELVKASELPLSVIIVGIGDEDFSLMKLLDSDEGMLYSKKLQRAACRDIVQFVPFKTCKDRPEVLAKEVLYEIPNQVVEYMTSKGIHPNRSIQNQELLHSARSGLSSRRFSQMPSPMYIHPSSMILLKHKNLFMKKLESLGLTSERFLDLVDQGVPCMDPQIISEHVSTRKTETPRLKSILKRPEKLTQTLPPILRKESLSSRHKICKICRERNADIILLDCGHRVVCEICVAQIGSGCPECRNTVIKWVSVYKT
jgi:hypothetical protein